MALLIALWLVVLLSLLAATHSRTAHSEIRLASQHTAAAEGRALAEAGIHRAILDLLSPDADRHWSVNGTPRAFRLGGRPVLVSIRDATGLVDLNAGSGELIGALVATAGVEEDVRQAIVDAILDWRDADDLTRLSGAEDGDYAAIALPWEARDGAFASVEELRNVMGMNQAVYDAIARYATVYSGRGGVALEFAPARLIGVLTGRELPGSGEEDAADGDRPVLSSNAFYHVIARAGVAAVASVSVEAVVEISSGADVPFVVHHWRESVIDPSNVES
jgi:general secretion pathway protein K